MAGSWKKFILDGDSGINIGTAGVATGSLVFKGTTSGAVTLTVLAEAGTYSLTLPPDDGSNGQQLTTDGSGVLTWAASGAGVTAWDDIGDPDADATVAFAGYEETITSTLNEAAHTTLTLTNSTADVTAAVTLLKLTYADDGQVNGNYFECLDNASGDSKFSIGVNGNTLIAGTLGVTGAITGNVTGNASGSSGSCTGNAATVTVADAANDAETWPLLGTAATGSLAPATDSSLTYNANTGALASTLFAADTITANTAAVPDANGGAALGTTALQWSNLFLVEGAAINWDNGDFTMTQAGNLLTITGGNLDLVRNPIQNLVMENETTVGAPATPTAGQIFYDTTLDHPYVWIE